jgi:hypothetical protein
VLAVTSGAFPGGHGGAVKSSSRANARSAHPHFFFVMELTMSEFPKLALFAAALTALVFGGLEFKILAGAPLKWDTTTTLSEESTGATRTPFHHIPEWNFAWF